MSIRGQTSGAKAALAAGILLWAAGLSLAFPAAAAGERSRGPSVAVATASAATVKDPESTGSLQKPEEAGPNCAQSRKRLWVEEEGWVVRRVTTCY